MSRRKLRRDREAGLHFHWHLPQGSFSRLVIGALVATLFWGALLAYVEVRLPTPPPLAQRATELEVVDLDNPANRWLAEVIDRESPFHARWEVGDDSRLEKAIRSALTAAAPPPYQPALIAIGLASPAASLTGLPGLDGRTLPPPLPVKITPIERPEPQWYITVTPQSSQIKWDGFSFRWSGENASLSPGESWSYQLLLDWRGIVISCLPLDAPRNPRALKIAQTLRKFRYPSAEKDAPLRQWQVEARTVDRSPQ